MTKIPSLEVPSDDCEVASGGQVYRPHEGERVWLWPDSSINMLTLWQELSSMFPRVAAAKGEPDEVQQVLDITTSTFRHVAEAIAPRLDRWDWTDERGQPLPPPSVEVLLARSVEELMWLVAAVRGETPAAKKNGSNVSPITSSASAPPPSQELSSMAPSRSRAS